jgi:ATP-dependent RNA helicase HelY
MTIERGFALDRFQEEAIAAVDAGRSVLVAAPTSSGKTVVAEHAVEAALTAGRRAFYTTPIKALSNQKFRDLGAMFGPDRVGLMTGDQVVAPDAAVVVMTTEVLRNMLYADSSAVDDLAWAVLDEVHFLEDPYRGAVWEEVLLHLAPTVGIVALSATVSNAAELGDWVTSVRGPTDVIVETRRPVRLRAHYLVAERGRHGSSRKVHRTALLANGGKPNPAGRRFDQDGRPSGGQAGGKHRGRGSGGPWVPPRRNEVVSELAGADLLPAIHFIFSRAGCDEARDTVVRDGLVLNDDREAAAVDAHIAERLEAVGESDRSALRVDHWADALRRGIASHHAGLVPLFKEVTEELFIAGLVKLVYATETLALGVNLPARSVVIDRLTKFTGETHEVLTPGQFTQLTGRAGRRGLDVEGHALVCWSPFVPFDRVAGLAGSRDFVLRSAFRPTYNMVANMVEGRTRAEAVDLLARSFAQFQMDRRTATRLRRNSEKREEAALIRGRLDNEVRQPVLQTGGKIVSAAVLRPGDIVVPDDGLAHVVLSVANRGGGRIRVRTLSQEGRVSMLSDGAADGDDLVGDPELVGQMLLPAPFAPDDRGFRREVARGLADFVVDPSDRTVRGVPTNGAPELAKDRKRLARLERDLAREADRPADVEGDLTARFDAAFDVLSARGMVDGWSLTRRGQPLTQIHNEADLLVAEVLDAGILRGLSPSMTAAVVSCLTYRKRGPGDPSTVRLAAPFPDCFDRLTELAGVVAAAEVEAGLKPADLPDPGFAHCIHAWAGGAELGDVLDDDLPAGEFVRNVRLVADLLRQVAATAGPEVAAAALEAQEGIDRGVIAMSSGTVDSEANPEPSA